MSDPRQPELRRSDKAGATPQDVAELKARQTRAKAAHAHGTDKGDDKGAGEGGGVPPDQQTDHP